VTRRSAVLLTLAAALPSIGSAQAAQAAQAPARGAPAVWVFDGKLFTAGGKYSVNESGAQRFICCNDVWSMSPRAR
jgi:hypothetical protein